jgi:creatinine amidohydrolase
MTRWSSISSARIAERIARGQTLAVLPIGATEQHGPHLPTGVDTLLVESICAAACERADVLMLPPLTYGCSHGHTARWAGTLSLSPRLLAAIIEQTGAWAVRSGIDRLLIVSGHASNVPSIESAILQLRYDFPKARFATRGLWELSAEARRLYTLDGEDVHANLAETAMLLAIRPSEGLGTSRGQD